MLIGNYRANVETDFDLKNAQVILNYFVPESILFVKHGGRTGSRHCFLSPRED